MGSREPLAMEPDTWLRRLEASADYLGRARTEPAHQPLTKLVAAEPPEPQGLVAPESTIASISHQERDEVGAA